MSNGTMQLHPVSPSTVSKLMIPITMSDGHVQHHPASPQTVDCLVEDTSRAMARHQALESPLSPRSSAIPQTKIASYPWEWRDGARSSKYSYIPSYQEWHQGEQPELARSELAGPSRPTARPLSPVPRPSTRTEPIEQPAFEGPGQSSRVRQQRQRPDNVYGDDPFVDHLVEENSRAMACR